MSDDEEYKYTDIQLDLYMTTCLDLVLQAGEIIKKVMRQDHRSKFNLKDEDCKEGNASSVLTETDTAVEKHLIDVLIPKFGKIGILSLSSFLFRVSLPRFRITASSAKRIFRPPRPAWWRPTPTSPPGSSTPSTAP